MWIVPTHPFNVIVKRLLLIWENIFAIFLKLKILLEIKHVLSIIFHVISKQFTRKYIADLTHPEPKSICINEIVTNVYYTFYIPNQTKNEL